jgi:hypothetical protein
MIYKLVKRVALPFVGKIAGTYYGLKNREEMATVIRKMTGT